ncbi:MAG: ribosome-associated translation inhibitor RaiA [Bdellovibrio sp.]|nr:ribosome-associated translation inhibitor RaiA [Bdellovibrio sp.]
MVLNISFKHINSNDVIKDYAREKSERFKKYFSGKIHVTWNFTKEKENNIAHCHLVGNRMDYFGETSSHDLFFSIDKVTDKIQKQLRRHKEIVKNHLHHNHVVNIRD